jgi:mono/diheme cytochrome c family protein
VRHLRRTPRSASACSRTRPTASSATGPEGDGRGDPRSPGKGANLHTTQLGRDALVEVVTCGRVGTEMPYFDKYAYEDRKCRGLSEADLGKDMPPFPHSNSLTQREIAAVVDYILATFVGK